MATIRKRGETYQIRVSSGYDSSGKQIIKTKTWKPLPGMTPKQIEKELSKQAVLFEQQVETGQFLDGTITLAEFADKWFKEYAEKHLKEKTLTGYRDIMPRIINAMGHIRLAKLQPHHLIEFYNNLAEKGQRQDIKYKPCADFKEILKKKRMSQVELAKKAGVSTKCVASCVHGQNVAQGTAEKITTALNRKNLFVPVDADAVLSGSTIAKYHRLLSTICTTAVQWQVIPSNPCSRVKPPHVENKEAPVLDDVQVQQLIECLNDEPLKYKTAIMLILYTGLRRGELCGLEWDDVDFKNEVIHVTKELLYTPNKGVYEDTTKSKRSQRVIRIPSEMIILLKHYKAEQSRQRLKYGDYLQNCNKIFTSDKGGQIHPDSLSGWYSKFIERHGLPDSHIHTLRHVSATLLIAGGVDIATVSNRLGHANTSTTLNIYTHAIQSADAIAAEKLQNILSPTKNYNAG